MKDFETAERKMGDKPVFLLGAGSSVDAGIPTTNDMTKTILKKIQESYRYELEEKVLKYVIGGMQFRRGVKGGDPFAGINIEDLFSAVEMLADRNELDIAPFVGTWSPTIEEIEKSDEISLDSWRLESDFKELVENLIRDIDTDKNSGFGGSFSRRQSVHIFHAKHSLEKLIENIFNSIKEAFRGKTEAFSHTADTMLRLRVEMVWIEDEQKIKYIEPLITLEQGDVVTIASLNYDNVIELCAEKMDIKVATGLTSWSQVGVIDPPKNGIELLKLHGSVDWDLQQNQRTRNKIPHDIIQRAKIEDIRKGYRYRPAVVFGSGNKLTAQGPFIELFRAFGRRIENCILLVTIGYSFRDEHINEVLKRWLNANVERQMIVITREGSDPNRIKFIRECRKYIKDRIHVHCVGARRGIQDRIWEGI
ncbi:MAG: SIR2 family protein [Fidelibacterota bacterium]|nr:MAG: SIR2 family protein [Candidatus Neomarinimicrobiota bacterium]